MSCQPNMDQHQFNIAYINRNVQTDARTFPEEKLFVRSFQNLTFIVGEPGNGKSTTLRFLASKYKDSHIFFNFSECSHNDLTNENSDLYVSPIDYIFNQTNDRRDDLIKTEYEQDRNTGKLGIFLDGFDDIFRFYDKKTLVIIRGVLKENCSVFITSSDESLPEHFKAKCNMLVDFDDNHKKKYFEYSNLSNEHAKKEYLKTALHLKMYCEVHDKMKGDSLVDVYSAYINNEIGIFCKNYSEDNYEEIFETLIDLHLKLAVLYCFGNVVIEHGIITEEEITLMKDSFKLYGFVGLIRVILNDRIVFVHSCYAEYLAAEWLYKTENNVFLLATTFKYQNHQRIADFFNQIINSKNPNPAVSAIISNDLAEVRKLCHMEDDCLVHSDDIGRYPIHIAAWYSQYNRLYAFLDAILKSTELKNQDILRRKDTRLKLTYKDYRDIRKTEVDTSLLKEIERLIDNGIHPDTIFINEERQVTQNKNSYYDKSALNYSILHKFGRDTTIKLLQKGANTEREDITNAFYFALNCIDSPEPLYLLLKYGNNQNKLDDLLLTAAFSRSDNADEKLKLLLEHGANPDTKDYMGRDVLQIAVLKKRRTPIPKMKTLLQHGVNPNMVNDDGRTSLHIAASINYDGCSEQLKLLLENGGDPNVKDKNGKNVLHIASANYMDESYEMVELLIKKVSDINTEDKDGKNCLHCATGYSYGRSIDKIKLLLEHGANPNQIDNSGRTPLHYAASSHDAGKARLLINLVDVNHLDLEGKSALHFALENPSPDSDKLVKLLLENGADPCLKDLVGKSCLHYANSVEKVNMLLNKGANPLVSDNNGRNCLHHAALSDSNGSLGTLKIFLDILNPALSDNDGQNTLHHAALSNSNDCLKKLAVLIENKLEVNKTDNTGKHSLFSAIVSTRDSQKKIKFLLENGALPNLADVEGKTCLHYIVIGDSYAAVSQAKTILKMGGDITIKDNDGKTCKDYCNPASSIGKLFSVIQKD